MIVQEIIHDGLVGSEYLYEYMDRYRFSFDLAGERMVLSALGSPPAG